MPALRRPIRLCSARTGHGVMHILLVGLGDFCQNLPSSWVTTIKMIRTFADGAIYEMPKSAIVVLQPLHCLLRGFKGGAVFHRFKYFFYAHRGCPNLSLSQCMPVPCRIGAGDMMFQLPFNIAQKRRGSKTEQIRPQPLITQFFFDHAKID